MDATPILSQAKSALQWLSGNSAGARQTQENFLTYCPGVSQMCSLAHLALGEGEEASRIQRQFFNQLVPYNRNDIDVDLKLRLLFPEGPLRSALVVPRVRAEISLNGGEPPACLAGDKWQHILRQIDEVAEVAKSHALQYIDMAFTSQEESSYALIPKRLLKVGALKWTAEDDKLVRALLADQRVRCRSENVLATWRLPAKQIYRAAKDKMKQQLSPLAHLGLKNKADKLNEAVSYWEEDLRFFLEQRWRQKFRLPELKKKRFCVPAVEVPLPPFETLFDIRILGTEDIKFRKTGKNDIPKDLDIELTVDTSIMHLIAKQLEAVMKEFTFHGNDFGKGHFKVHDSLINVGLSDEGNGYDIDIKIKGEGYLMYHL
ncbi:hypothetical protein CYMTET_2968 [Cymbomonas tetramitiformis]|uniref:Uncharacterized protein n=1 Tax=Cymbomonas tetramitiformis TaxID=36881 RepID=A0AAE0LLV2_9CHLO|nr:hypothetical protein CYMTET_2968 [Cymbomonas tetramitiformis]